MSNRFYGVSTLAATDLLFIVALGHLSMVVESRIEVGMVGVEREFP